jgi:hypothetical protein
VYRVYTFCEHILFGQTTKHTSIQLWSAPRMLNYIIRIITATDLRVTSISEIRKRTKLGNVSIGFWRWCITHWITGVSDFIHRPDSNNYKKEEEQTWRFGNWICFRPQVRGDTYSVGSLQWLRLALSKGSNRIGVSPHLRTETDPASETSCLFFFFLVIIRIRRLEMFITQFFICE